MECCSLSVLLADANDYEGHLRDAKNHFRMSEEDALNYAKEQIQRFYFSQVLYDIKLRRHYMAEREHALAQHRVLRIEASKQYQIAMDFEKKIRTLSKRCA
jgi:hypothetical protein